MDRRGNQKILSWVLCPMPCHVGPSDFSSPIVVPMPLSNEGDAFDSKPDVKGHNFVHHKAGFEGELHGIVSSSPKFLVGSPPQRPQNPIVHDALFGVVKPTPICSFPLDPNLPAPGLPKESFEKNDFEEELCGMVSSPPQLFFGLPRRPTNPLVKDALFGTVKPTPIYSSPLDSAFPASALQKESFEKDVEAKSCEKDSSSSTIFSGPPPCEPKNPLAQDALLGAAKLSPLCPVPSGSTFPATVRVEGFECP